MIKRTSLYDEHVRLGGRMIDFGGWDMPVQYTGVMEEHLACRNSAGLFDVSHMGEVEVEGPDAEAYLNFLVTNDVTKIAIGQAQYSVMCNERGGAIDDLLIYKRGEDRFFVVINASNTPKDVAWMRSVLEQNQNRFSRITLRDSSPAFAQIAIQGPQAATILQKLTSVALEPIKTYRFAEGPILQSIPAILARTGYTGEDGFEIYVPWERGPELWRALLEVGQAHGIKPCGLGARDTLRLEMKYPLYGNELNDETLPLEAGLGWVVKLDKPDFIGKAALVAAKAKGIQRSLVGIKLLERGIPRHGYPVFSADGTTRIGELTSGTQSPSLKTAIGVAYVPASQATLGSRLSVEIRGVKIPAEVVATPFYKRPY